MSSDDQKPEAKKPPKKNKRPKSWKFWAGWGGAAGTLLAVGKVGYDESVGNTDYGLRQVRHEKIDSDGDGVKEDWRILREDIYPVHSSIPIVQELRKSGTIDEAEIRKKLGLSEGKLGDRMRILERQAVYENSPENILFAAAAPNLSRAVSEKIKWRKAQPLDKIAARSDEYGRREVAAKTVLYENLLDKAVALYAESDEGKALIEQKRRAPRQALIDHFDYLQNVSSEAMALSGITKTEVDLNAGIDSEVKHIYDGLKTPEKDEEREKLKHTPIVKLALNMLTRLTSVGMHKYPADDVIERLRTSVENKSLDAGQEALARTKLILDNGPFVSRPKNSGKNEMQR